MIPNERLLAFLDRVEALLDRADPLLPAAVNDTDWSAQAFRWRVRNGRGQLEAVRHPHAIALDQLVNVSLQRERLVANTRQFVEGRLANNVLLTGARGCGKSSLVKAVWNEFRDRELRLIEVEKTHLHDLADIVEQVGARPERFIVFCDDLSFEEGDHGYQALKTALDGSIAATSANVLIYATSNRRHLVPEYFSENAQTRHEGGEIHFAEAIEEKVALSERFGLWLSFYGFSQDEYLAAVRNWLGEFGVAEWDAEAERAALQWAQGRGARSGRIAWQFARDWAGGGNAR
ncbi:ATP-binding protein [Chitiniphilus eburneus]|uniref:ATP-binding protein n=1 Tax=Chitiniphilus eburneus TaxID=2571148 RepID=A0A4V5MRD3_9NEIS|nr:ATP-binding protein [Chitiniphilus eburneus]TJZ75518.1 ATP-binding protein [Chitiniphilus eburneus]